MLDQLRVARHLEFIGPALLPGHLIDLGEYPGLLLEAPTATTPPSPAETGIRGIRGIIGELFRVLDPAALALLDAYEGYQPDQPERSPFVRLPLPLLEPRITAWVYQYMGSTRGHPRVPGASWPEYRRARDAAGGASGNPERR